MNGGEGLNLFICSTPFQIITAVNIVVTKYKNEKVDVYILDHSPECYKYYCKLKDNKIFNNVYFLKTRDAYVCNYKNKINKILSYAKKAYNAMNYRWLEKKIPNKDSLYKKIFIAYPDLPTQILYYFHKKNNISLELYFYEEGVFTYSAFKKKWSRIRKKFSKLLFGSFIFDDCIKVLSYQPNLIKTGNYKFQKELIPKLDKGNNLLINLLINLTEERGTSSKYLYDYIYFDQPFELDCVKKKQEQLIKFILKNVGTENFGYKIHPRNNKINNFNCNIINSRVPFELYEINSDVKNKVLISLYSTACLNPKILFDEEPYVILLYELIHLPDIDTSIYEIAQEVRESYIYEKRFFIPKTIEEFESILNFLKGELNNK